MTKKVKIICPINNKETDIKFEFVSCPTFSNPNNFIKGLIEFCSQDHKPCKESCECKNFI